MIKKQIKMFLMIFCLLFASASAVFWLTPVSTEAANTGDAKTGLVKEKGKYYYYVINKNGQSEKERFIHTDIILEKTEQHIQAL